MLVVLVRFIFLSFFFLSAGNILGKNKKPASKEKVIVVGAGIAGLVAAKDLLDHGYDVEVWEANPLRVGGRLFSVKVAGSIAELGGEDLLDGGDANYLIQYANQLGIKVNVDPNPYYDIHFFGQDKKTVRNLDLFVEEKFPFDDSIDERTVDAMIEKAMSAKPMVTMADFLQAFFAKQPKLLEYFDARTQTNEGVSTKEIDASYAKSSFRSQLWSNIKTVRATSMKKKPIALSNTRFIGGNASLPLALAKVLGKRIRMGVKLDKIQVTKDGSYRLVPTRGRLVKAKYVVLAIPASMYKYINVEEGLYKQWQQIVSSNVMARSGKVLVPLTWNKEPIGVAQSLSFVARLNQDRKVAALYFTNLESKDTSAMLDIARDHSSFLEQVFPATKVELGGKFETPVEQFAACKEGCVKNWSEEQFTEGAYSIIPPGKEMLLEDNIEYVCEQPILQLFSPYKNTLFFAGEHTSHDARGTIIGAFESGIRAAKMLENCSRPTAAL